VSFEAALASLILNLDCASFMGEAVSDDFSNYSDKRGAAVDAFGPLYFRILKIQPFLQDRHRSSSLS
jgi:hypothetical protein